MGQNNRPRDEGNLQGNQGGQLDRNSETEKELRQKDEGYAAPRGKPPADPPAGKP